MCVAGHGMLHASEKEQEKTVVLNFVFISAHG